MLLMNLSMCGFKSGDRGGLKMPNDRGWKYVDVSPLVGVGVALRLGKR